MIDGLIAGITAAGGGILSAMTGAVTGAINGAKSLLGIASPSKVFAEIGTQTGEGMAQGVDGSAATVQGSLESMVAPPDASPGSAGGGGAAAKAGGHTFQITINAEGGDGQSIAAAVRDAVLALLEGDVAQFGSAVPNA
jgi:hypothetical protein